METEVLVALVGVGGTLGGVALGQGSAALMGWRQRRRETATRWVADQKEQAAAILSRALRLERQAWDVAAQLDQEERDERLPGHGASLLLLPAGGIPGVVDEIALLILREAVEDGFEQLDLLENEVETYALIAEPEAVTAVRQLVECLWNVYGAIESFSTFDQAADAVERARSARDAFANRVRSSLGVSGNVTTDPRPRRDEEEVDGR
ncbi:hypothetical protein AB0O90_14220 [Microbacterium testaceum]|uniref:hypothetical protein n=1 Tax=Microbacterium testaceum TaxID=2033 RepID=UPI00341F196B